MAASIARVQFRSFASRAGVGLGRKDLAAAPFESQVESATNQYRVQRQKVLKSEEEAGRKPHVSSIENLPHSRQVLEVGGVSRAYQESATSTHRRKTNQLRDHPEKSGSVASSLSATAQRQRNQRKAHSGYRPSGTPVVNPSSYALPITDAARNAELPKEVPPALISTPKPREEQAPPLATTSVEDTPRAEAPQRDQGWLPFVFLGGVAGGTTYACMQLGVGPFA
mmetsp:Transcript_42872/g.63614  ORF Transcript_42872/g.63614 Transcript_42872/m.63614 type:complete len:225 (-) Transcript_42872:304-978(-)